MQERIYLKFIEGYVKIAHIIETGSLIKIALDQEVPSKCQRNNELTIHDTKTHIKDIGYSRFINDKSGKYVFEGDPPENNGYPYETKIGGQSVGYENIPSGMVLPVYQSYISGIPRSYLSPVMDKEGLVVEVSQRSNEKMIFSIHFTQNHGDFLDGIEGGLVVVETTKGNVIFSACPRAMAW